MDQSPVRSAWEGSICGHLCSLSLPSLHQVLFTDELQSNHGFPCWPHPFLQLPPEDIPQGTLEEADLNKETKTNKGIFMETWTEDGIALSRPPPPCPKSCSSSNGRGKSPPFWSSGGRKWTQASYPLLTRTYNYQCEHFPPLLDVVL